MPGNARTFTASRTTATSKATRQYACIGGVGGNGVHGDKSSMAIAGTRPNHKCTFGGKLMCTVWHSTTHYQRCYIGNACEGAKNNGGSQAVNAAFMRCAHVQFPYALMRQKQKQKRHLCFKQKSIVERKSWLMPKILLMASMCLSALRKALGRLPIALSVLDGRINTLHHMRTEPNLGSALVALTTTKVLVLRESAHASKNKATF